ncbi:DnaT-like ssDNA-binding domain-containing protein [Alteromonas sp. ASW11-130]|uniref:DnaT-like ssDNA-binding domain-containing protein n=1 Tax=Alteromonas sp. ASW11-130 TaxID=3015775 RepID=UPI002242424A|nr:DnaT-like ssDNA-binding domain-containing protein [Alteromonas sp. ASW11-130]MCW8093426.1 DnaT-like ssDNA-binding domain-containing protein [Alteromonas sp. ASW11-130]
MFTEAEYHALCGPLTNAARVVYCLGLRPTANTTTAASEALNYKFLLALVNADSTEQPFTRGRHINDLLKTLEQAGLIALPSPLSFESSLNGKVILLPLIQAKHDSFSHLHRQHQAINMKWQPDDALFEEMATLLGLANKAYDQDDINEFIGYWLGRPTTVLSHFQWTQKFVYSLRSKRLGRADVAVRTRAENITQVAPSVEADDNTRKLVEKYPRKQ